MSRKLYPNVDFYSGIIYSALGIPRSMFTVLFAIARTAGWVAHWQEMVSDPHMRIGRPRQLYTGPTTTGLSLDRQALMSFVYLDASAACASRMAAAVTGLLLGIIAAAPAAPAPMSRRRGDGVPAGRTYCADSDTPVALGSAQWNGWGHGIENTRYQPEPAIRATDVAKLALKWAFGFQAAPSRGSPPSSTVACSSRALGPGLFAGCQERMHLLDL